jgi:hypothetical protein
MVRDKEEAIGRTGDGSKEGRSCTWSGRDKGVVVWEDGDGCSNWERGRRRWKRWPEGSGTRTGLDRVSKLKQRRVCGGISREPDIIVHLDIEGGFQRVKNRRMGVVGVTEAGCVDRSAGEQGWG